jgi:hypothetical protein
MLLSPTAMLNTHSGLILRGLTSFFIRAEIPQTGCFCRDETK